jgi:protein dithiol oxidoreductase (disulfide-forming)
MPRLTRRTFHRFLLAGLAAALMPGAARADLVEGRDWRPVTPARPGATPGKIEVLEFFSYGCPHCADLGPLIGPWASRLPADVAFRRVPVSFGRAAWASLARLYFALELTNNLGHLDHAVFQAVTRERRNLFTDKAILAWLADQGVDTGTFATMLSSFAVETQVAQSDALVRDFNIDAVPTIVVDGRFVVLNREAKGFQEILAAADRLIALARSQNQPS